MSVIGGARETTTSRATIPTETWNNLIDVITGVLISRPITRVPGELEELKKDPDRPPILVRRQLISKKGAFGVLREVSVNMLYYLFLDCDFYHMGTRKDMGKTPGIPMMPSVYCQSSPGLAELTGRPPL